MTTKHCDELVWLLSNRMEVVASNHVRLLPFLLNHSYVAYATKLAPGTTIITVLKYFEVIVGVDLYKYTVGMSFSDRHLSIEMPRKLRRGYAG